MQQMTYYVLDEEGRPISGASCYLYIAETETVATGVTDIDGNPMTIPFLSNTKGRIQFAAPNGEYDLRIIATGRDDRIRIQCLDASEQVAAAQGYADAAAGSAAEADDSAAIAAANSNGMLRTLSGMLDGIISGPITRDSSGAATAAAVLWPDGATGVYTATTLSAEFPGAVDAYTVTYVNGDVSKTCMQSAVTRNSSGDVVVRPNITVTEQTNGYS